MNYHDRPEISQTKLKLFCKSPREYYLTCVTGEMPKPEPSTVMDIGSICHAVLLEGCDISDLVVELPESCLKSNGAINPKPTAEFKSANAGKYVLKADKFQQVESIIEAVANHELSTAIADAIDREKEIYWVDKLTGLACRGKPDFVCDLGESVVCYDLKIAERIFPKDVERAARQFKSYLQVSHYCSGLQSIYGKPVTFRFWYVESVYPYRIHPYWYEQRSLEIGYGFYVKAMMDLKRACDTGDWSDKWKNEIVIGPWDLDSDLELEGAEPGERVEGDVDAVNAF